MEYDFEDVTEVHHDKAERRLLVTTHGKTHIVQGIDVLILKSVPFIDERGTVHLNKGRVSFRGNEAASGD
jgi:hypothetical protein